MTFEQSIVDGLRDIMEHLKVELSKEQRAQGHTLTGKSEKSYEYKIMVEAGRVRAIMITEHYVLALETGVRAENVRYPISVMIDYWHKRGLAGSEAVSAAWATKKKHEQKGIPTAASAAFSKTGQRTGFASTVLERDLELIGSILENKTGLNLEIQLAPELDRIKPLILSV